MVAAFQDVKSKVATPQGGAPEHTGHLLAGSVLYQINQCPVQRVRHTGISGWSTASESGREVR
jgi:hypothetical protein